MNISGWSTLSNNSLVNLCTIGLLHLQSWQSSCTHLSLKSISKSPSLGSDVPSVWSSSLSHLQGRHHALGCYCTLHGSSLSKNHAAAPAVSKGGASARHPKRLFTSLSETSSMEYSGRRRKLGSHTFDSMGCPKSFSQILRSEKCLENFHAFLEQQGGGIENLLSFWIAVESLKDVSDKQECTTRAQKIMGNFFSKTSSLSKSLTYQE